MFRIAKIWTAAVALLSQASARASISSVPALSAKRCTNPSARRSAYLANWTCSFGTVLGSVEPNWSDRQPTVAAAARALNANGIGSVSLSRQAPIHVALILKRSHGCAVLPENHLFFAWRPMSIEITNPRKEPKWVF